MTYHARFMLEYSDPLFIGRCRDTRCYQEIYLKPRTCARPLALHTTLRFVLKNYGNMSNLFLGGFEDEIVLPDAVNCVLTLTAMELVIRRLHFRILRYRLLIITKIEGVGPKIFTHCNRCVLFIKHRILCALCTRTVGPPSMVTVWTKSTYGPRYDISTE